MCDCIIGIIDDYDNYKLVTVKELEEHSKESIFTMKEYLDWRYNTNLNYRFVYCPYCGKKIDWNKLRKEYK